MRSISLVDKARAIIDKHTVPGITSNRFNSDFNIAVKSVVKFFFHVPVNRSIVCNILNTSVIINPVFVFYCCSEKAKWGSIANE